MEVMLATELQDNGLARRSLDLSCLDDIPEERALSNKSSEEKEITRLDSGLGEWDSESSRKTSFSSQGRLSPDCAMSKDSKEINGKCNDVMTARDTAVKRRRSGIDMMNSSPIMTSDTNGMEGNKPVVKTRLPKIPKSNRASGIWARKISPAGIQYLKMEDEMEEIIRNGKLVMVPRKISDHIPIVPIHIVDRFIIWEWNENLGLEDEELQIYKTPVSEVYELHRHRWEFFGKMDFRKMMILALDGNAWMNGQQRFEIMRDLVSQKDQKKMDKMLAQGYTHDEIVEHFMEDAKKKGGNTDLAQKILSMMNEDISDEEVIEMMRGELGEKSQKKMDELIKQGYTTKEIMKKMMTEGQTKEEETTETAETMKHLIGTKKKNIKTSSKDVEAMLNERLDEEAKAKMKEMLDKGIPMQEVLDFFVKQYEEEEQMTSMEKKVQDAKDAAAAAGKELSQYQIFELMKDQMDAESKKKMDEMLRSGCPLDQVIEHFMKKGKTKEEAQNEKSEQMRLLLEENKDMSPEQVMEMLRSELGEDDKKQMEKMLKSGCSMQEVIDHFVNRGYESESEEKTKFQMKMEEMLDGKHLNEDEILALMRSQVDDETKAEIKAMLEKGYTKQDVINHLMKTIKTDEEKEREAVKKLVALFDDQNMSEEEKVTLLGNQLNDEDKAQMEEMLKRGCTIEEVIGHFMNRSQSPDREKSNFAKGINKLIEGKNLSVDEVLNVIGEQLDDEQRQKMEEMLNKGYTKQDVINHFLRTAKTKEEKMQETAEKIKALMSDKSMSETSKLEVLRNQLSKEDLAQMEEMLRDGGTLEDVMQQILKSKSTESLVESELSSIVHKAMADGNMSNEKVLDLIKSQLDEQDIKEMELMLEKGMTEQEVIDHFLNHGKTALEKKRETSERLQAVLADATNPNDKLEVMRSMLEGADKAQMEHMLKSGCSIEEVIKHFSSRGMEPSGTSELALKIKKLSEGKSLTSDQILNLIEDQLSEEGKAVMEEMLDKGYSKEDIIQHFLTKGKTKLEEQSKTANRLSLLVNPDTMTEEEIAGVLKEELSPSERKVMDQMLKEGKSMKDIVKHFMEPSSNSELATTIKKLSEGKNLSSDQILSLIGDQLSDEGKAVMEEMLNKGYSKEDVIQHFLTKGKTKTEEQNKTANRLALLINPDTMTEAEIAVLMKEELSPSERKVMEQMLREGKSMKEVVKHFMEPSSTSEMAITIKKLSEGKSLSSDQILSLIGDQLSDEGKAVMEEMLDKGYSKEDIIQHFLTKGKTKLEERRETAQRLSLLIDPDTMTEEEIAKVMKEQLSPSERKLMDQMLKKGKTIKQIVRHFIYVQDIESVESALSIKIKKLSGGRKLSNEEMVELLAQQMGDTSRREMEDMLAGGASMEEVIQHFMSHGQTQEEEQREVGNKLSSLMSDSMTEEDIKGLLQSELNSTDRKKMDEMLMSGYSIEEILEHFQNRGMEREDETELAANVRKISRGQKLSNQEMLEIIKDQLGEDGRAHMEKMLMTGMSEEEVISHFLTQGKTAEEEHREVGLKLAEMCQGRKLSSEQKLELMNAQLGEADKAQMEQMLKNGCSIEEVFELFTSRGVSPTGPRSELANRVRKLSKGRILPKKDILSLIKMQLSDESKVQLEKMLEKGYTESDVIEHFLINGKTSDEEHREVAARLEKMIDMKSMSDDKILDIMNSVLNEFDKSQLEDMIRRGCSTPEIVHLFLNRGKNPGKKTEFAARMERLLNGQMLPPQEVLEIMRDNLDDESKVVIDQLLGKGYTVQDVIEHMMKTGKTPEEKQKEVAEKMLALLDSDMSEEQVLNIMRKQLGEAGCKELDDMLKRGLNLNEIIDNFMHKPSELAPVEEDTEFAKKIKQLMGDRTLSAEQMMSLIKSALDPNSQIQLDEMVKCGCSHDEVIQHFMNREKNKKGQKRNEFGRKIYELTKGKKLTKKELIMLMKNHLDQESLVKMEEMLKKGYPIEDVIDYFLKNGKTPQQALREKTVQKEKEKKEAVKKLKEKIEGNNLSNEEILAILQLSMGDEDRAQLDLMIKKGCSTQEIIEHFMNRDVSDEETEKTLFQKKINELIGDQELDEDQVLDLMMNELDDESVIQMNKMLQKGYTKDDVIKYFLKHGDDRNDFVNEMKKLAGDKDMSKDEILDLMKSKLGVMSQRKMEDMMREGYSAEEIIQHLMTHGKTQEQETKLFTRRMSILLEKEPTLSDKEKVEKMKEHLGKEAASMLEELIKNGFTHSGLLNLFLRHGNDVNSLVADDFFIRDIRFPPEPKDAYSHRDRDVFSVIDKEEIKSRISYMSPSGKMHIFGLFFEMVLEVVAGRGLTHREILDLMRFRMGAGYAKEFDELRKKGFSLQQIVDYFLRRDEETISESRLVAKLKAEARVDSRVYLKREYSKEKWGVSLTYTYSKNHGLHLILNEVAENGPAWESGVRSGDVIVTVNDWLIVLMDRPQVAAHLFQAGANIVKLGIQKTRGTSPDKYLGIY